MSPKTHNQLSLILGIFCLLAAGEIQYLIITKISIGFTLLFFISLVFMQLGVILFKPYQVKLKDISHMKFSERLKHLFDVEDK